MYRRITTTVVTGSLAAPFFSVLLATTNSCLAVASAARFRGEPCLATFGSCRSVGAILAAVGANYDAPLAAGLMVGASFYAAGFTVMAIAGAFGAGPRGQKIIGALMLALGSTAVAAALLITAVKTYAKYFPQ